MKKYIFILGILLLGFSVPSLTFADSYSRTPSGSTPDVPIKLTFSVTAGGSSANVMIYDSTKAKYYYDVSQTCLTPSGGVYTGTDITFDLTSVDINGNNTHPAYGDQITMAELWYSNAGDCSSHFSDSDFSGGDTYILTQSSSTSPSSSSTVSFGSNDSSVFSIFPLFVGTTVGLIISLGLSRV